MSIKMNPILLSCKNTMMRILHSMILCNLLFIPIKCKKMLKKLYMLGTARDPISSVE